MTASAIVLSPNTAFGRAAAQALVRLGYALGREAPSLLMLPLCGDGGLSESRVFVAEVLAAAERFAPVCSVIVHPLSLSALPPFGDHADFGHRAALAAAQLNRAWCAPLGVRVAQLFVDRLDMTANRAAPLDLDALDFGLRQVLAGLDEVFCDPAALAVWEAINGDW